MLPLLNAIIFTFLQNGLLSAAPFVAQLVTKFVFVYFAHKGMDCGFSLTAVTKALNSLGNVFIFPSFGEIFPSAPH